MSERGAPEFTDFGRSMNPGALFCPLPASLLSEATGSRGLATKSRQACCKSRWHRRHIDTGGCSRLDSRDGSLGESSSCSRPGLRNSRYSRSLRPDRHKSFGSRNASGPVGRPLQLGSLPGNRSLQLGGANLRRIDSSRSSGHHDCNDRSEPCKSTDRDRNRGDGRSAEILAVDVAVLDSLPENGTAPYGFVAVTGLSAAAGHAAADPGVDGTASGAAAAVQQAAADAVGRDALLAVAAGRAAPAAWRSGLAAVAAAERVVAAVWRFGLAAAVVAAGRAAPAAWRSGLAAVAAAERVVAAVWRFGLAAAVVAAGPALAAAYSALAAAVAAERAVAAVWRFGLAAAVVAAGRALAAAYSALAAAVAAERAVAAVWRSGPAALAGRAVAAACSGLTAVAAARAVAAVWRSGPAALAAGRAVAAA